MSLSTLQEVLAEVSRDAALRKVMRDDLDKALDSYAELSTEERETLLAILPDYLDAFVERRSLWRRLAPSSFKELGAAVVSLVLMGVLVYAVVEVFSAITTPVEIISVNGTEQAVDAWARAKEQLNGLFPFFAAVVSFWLGVSIESKRVEEQAAEKEDAKGDALVARGQKELLARNAEAAFARIEGAARGAQGGPPEDLQGGDGQVNRELILDLVKEGRASLR